MIMRGSPATVAVLIQSVVCRAAVVSYDWNVTWVSASPDGFQRPVIGINGEWPCPTIEATAGDNIVITLTNGLGNETTGIHFHGVDQYNTNMMDGTNSVVACPCAPGRSTTYNFTVGRETWCQEDRPLETCPGAERSLLNLAPPDPAWGI